MKYIFPVIPPQILFAKGLIVVSKTVRVCWFINIFLREYFDAHSLVDKCYVRF